MSPTVCAGALRKLGEVIERDGLPDLGVYYFGGEPLHAWDLIQFCESEGRKVAGLHGVPYRSSCTTNAVLSEARARWVARHLAFAIVSLDGPAPLHDRYRRSADGSPTHSLVERSLRIFESEGLRFALRCSVDAEMAPALAETVDYLCTSFRPAVINLEPIIPHAGCCAGSGLRPPPPADLVEAVIAAASVARRHRVPLKLSTASLERIAQSSCGVAEDNFVVAP